MATLTALALIAGSAALAGAATLAGNMEKAPPEPEPPRPSLPPQVPAPTPVPSPSYPDAGLAQDSQYSLGALSELRRQEAAAAPAPSLPIEEPVADMAGGAIGRPPWGKISSNVNAPEVPGATVSSVLGIKENPGQIKNDLMTLERQIENANFEVYNLNDRIARINALYTVERTKFIAELSKSKQAETTAGIYQKKLGNQGQQKGNKDPAVKELQAQIDRAPAGSDERKRLQAEKDSMTQGKAATDAEIEAWTKKFSEATALQVAANDDKAEAERKKNKYGVQLTELRTKQDEQEKLVKELIQKRAVLLGRLKAVLNENVKKEFPPADWETRTARFAKADKARLDAERRLKQFYSETWLPLEGQESQKQYKGQLDSLTVLWKNAKAEFELARAALTAAPQDSITTAGADFRAFVVEVDDITRNAVSNGKILDEWTWRLGTPRGYPQSIMTLKTYALKPKIVAAADVYYEIAKMDSTTLIRNASRFLNYFERILGSATRAPESEQRPRGIGRDITKVVLKEFIQNVLGNAANDVLLYPGVVDDQDPQARAYADLREKTNTFVDAQIYFINKMFKNIKQAVKDTKLSNVNGKNMIELEAKARQIYPILDGVPPMGQCARIFKPSTLEMLRTGKRNGKDLTEVLETPTLKDEFLNEIGFVKVSSFLEAQQFGKQPGINQADAIDLIKKAAFEEYTKNAERLAFERPGTQTFARVGGDWEFLNAMNGIGPLTTQTLNQLIPVPAGGNPLTTEELAKRLRAEANLHPFVPGVFLESNRVPPGPAAPRQRSLEPISEFRNACEIDGNVGSGREEADRIIAILDKLRDMEIEIKDKPVALLTFIDKLTKANKINSRRPDQGEATSVLSEKGFVTAFANHAIIKVATQDRKLNFVQTFLTFRSSLFRSIPYNDTVVHNGKTRNTREVYSDLVLDEIEKMPSFDVRTTAEKDAFPSDADWARLSTDFNLNFTIYYDNNGVGATDLSAANRPNTGSFIVFKEKNNRYFPVRFEPANVGAPGIPAGQPGAPVTTFNRGILGGAIDGIRIPVFSKLGSDLKEAITASKQANLPKTLEETVESQNMTGDLLKEALRKTAVETTLRCREVIQTIMARLPESESGKSFSQLPEKYKDEVKAKLIAENFTDKEIDTCLATDIGPKPNALQPKKPATIAQSSSVQDLPAVDPITQRVGQLQDSAGTGLGAASRPRQIGTSGLPGSGFGDQPLPIVPETPEFKAELDALMMKPTQDKALVDAIVNAATGVDNITKQYVRGLLESALRQKEYNTVKLLENWNTYQKSRKQSIIRKIDSISAATRLFQNLERPAPAAQQVAAQAQLEAANRKPLGPGDSAANQLDSGPQRLGGRHKTTTNWRRSKPSRYTRRKF
jgi:hypothetical protein